MRKINFNFVQQPTPRTCVHACLSMVTGVPVHDLVDRFGDRGLLLEHQIAVLIENGIFPDVRYHIAPEFPKGFYLASAPSLNFPGGLHRVVVEVNDEWDFVVHDPNRGRDGVQWYPQDAMEGGSPPLWMITAVRLDTDMLAHMRPAVETPPTTAEALDKMYAKVQIQTLESFARAMQLERAKSPSISTRAGALKFAAEMAEAEAKRIREEG